MGQRPKVYASHIQRLTKQAMEVSVSGCDPASSALRQAESELPLSPGNAIRILNEWLPRIEAAKNDPLVCDAWDLMGRWHLMFGRDLDANHAFETALRHAEEAGDIQRACRVRKNIGIALLRMKAYHQALQYFLDVRETAQREGFILLEGQAENNIAVIHHLNGNYEAARIIFLRLLENVDAMGLSLAIAHFNLADVNLMLGDLDQVARHIRAGKLVAKEDGRTEMLAGFSCFVGALQRRRKQYATARAQLERASRKCSESHRMEEQVRCFFELSLLFKDIDDFGNMMKYSREVISSGRAHGMMDETVHAYENLIVGLRVVGDGKSVMEACRDYAAFLEERESHDAIRLRVRMEMELELIDVARSQRRLERELAIDPLTGLNSYRMLPRKILETRLRMHAPAVLLYLDLDNLKQVNDSHGHMVGDQLIIAFAREIRKALPEQAIATRKSGDEFVVFLPETRLRDAVVRLERFLKDVSEIHNIGGVMLPLACSVGLAEDTENSEEPAKLVERADMAMLEAKRAGRARYVIADAAKRGGGL